MSVFVIVIILSILLGDVCGFSSPFFSKQGEKLGTDCAICTIGLGILEKTAEDRNQTIVQYLDEFCDAFNRRPSTKNWVQPCKDVVNFAGPIILKLLTIGLGPDDICLALKVCDDPQCRLYPGPVPPSNQFLSILSKKFAYIDPFGWIKELLAELETQEPIDDMDHDIHSPEPYLRGYHWRGIDANDQNSNIRPGYSTKFETTTFPSGNIDANGNGVYGKDPTTGKLYEELYCNDSGSRGIMMIGDSATGGFGLSFQPNMSPEELADFLLDEGDAPYCTWNTGWFDTLDTIDTVHCTDTPGILGQSIYSTMVKRNKCNKNDYINLSVNGMRSSHLSGSIHNYSVSRNPKTDKPLLVIIGMTGDDVCNPHPGMSHMTTPEEFESNILIVLDVLDTFLPPDSHVVFYGQEYGLFMWEYEYNRTHPALQIPYGKLWQYMDCIEANACTGWLTNNATLRYLTQQRADDLNQVFAELASNPPKLYSNFDLYNLPNPSKEIQDDWIKSGQDYLNLRFAQGGGGHPSQVFHNLIAQKLLSDPTLQKLMGPINPHNKYMK